MENCTYLQAIDKSSPFCSNFCSDKKEKKFWYIYGSFLNCDYVYDDTNFDEFNYNLNRAVLETQKFFSSCPNA